MIICLSTGHGIFRILMNILSFIVISCVNIGDNDKNSKLSAIIFFLISSFILLITLLIIFLLAYKTDFFKYYLGTTEDVNIKKSDNIENEINNSRITDNISTSLNYQEYHKRKKKNQKQKMKN